MNGKLMIGVLVGAVLLLATFGAVASASAFDDSADENVTGGSVNALGDCDQTKDQLKLQEKDQLHDGTCDNCTGPCASGNMGGDGTMEQTMTMQQTQLKASVGDALGEFAYRYMNQVQMG